MTLRAPLLTRDMIFITRVKKIATPLFIIVLFLFASTAYATVIVTPTTGGESISADTNTTNGVATWTTLTGPTIREGAYRDFPASGTFILNVPSGFSFNTGAAVTATITRVAGTGTCFRFTSTTATPTTSTITFTLNARDGGSNTTRCEVVYSNIQVRPTVGTPLATGNIVKTGTANVSGITASVTNLGTLTEVPGAKNKLTFITQPSAAALVGTDFATKPLIAVQDQYSNTITTDNTSTITHSTVLSTQACGGVAGSGTLSSTPASGATVSSGTINYTAMQYSAAESIKICAASTGAISALSNTVTVSKINTTTTIATSGTPAVYGNTVTFTATVTPASGGAPSGTVTFLDGGVAMGTGVLNGANPGVATYSTTTLSVLGSPHSITASYGGSGTFNTSVSSAISQSITAKALTVTGITANDKQYDTFTTATLNVGSAVLNGVIGSDAVTLSTVSAAGTFASPNVGTGILVQVSGLTISGAQAGNYTLTQPTTTASITAKALTVTGITANDKVYDGNDIATLNTTSALLVGVIGSDSVTLDTTGAVGTFATSSVGTNILVTVSGLTISGSSSGNYSLIQPTTSASITNPVPTTTSLSPSSAAAGGSGFILTVNGANFVTSSVVRWNGSTRATTFISPTQLSAEILFGDIASEGTSLVTVYTPTPGGGTSNAQTFTINQAQNPVPTTTSISPSSSVLGGVGFAMTVNGTNFIASSTAEFNGSPRVTTYISSSQLSVSILSSDLSVATSSALITVSNPTPGGGTSNAQMFQVLNPVPSTTSISPISGMVGDGQISLVVNGSNFIPSSFVNFNGYSRATIYNNANQLTATIPATDFLNSGTFPITVTNPVPGGGTSNAQTFTVNNPVPTLVSVVPATAVAGSPGLTMTINGTNFVASSTVLFNGSARVTTFASSTELTAEILSTDLTTVGTSTVSVSNSAPGGGVSNTEVFTVVPPVDTIAPTVTAFAIASTSSSLTVPITMFTATDNVAIAGYLVNEASTTPSISDSGWASTTPSMYTFATQGSKTLYAWAKDASNNISDSKSATTTISLPDGIAPVVSVFTIPATSTSLTVPITTLSATDNVGVAGYLVTEASTTPSLSDPSWTTTPITSYTFGTQGTKNLYAWAKDAAGNISVPLSATTTITFIEISPAQIQDQIAAGVMVPLGVATSTTQVTFMQEVHVVFGGGTTIILPFNTILSTASSSDFTQLSATTAVLTTDLPTNYSSVGAVQYGLPTERLTTSQPVTIQIAVGTSRNGQTLSVFKKEAGSTTWTAYTTCLVSGGICQFTTTSFSSFAVAFYATPTTPVVTAPSLGGVVAPTKVNFSGQAYPGSTVDVYFKSSTDALYRSIPQATYNVSPDGTFDVTYTGLFGGNYVFGLQAEDKDGQKSGIVQASVDLLSYDKLIVQNLLLPPTLSFLRTSVRLGDVVTVSGYAATNSSVEFEIDGKLSPVKAVAGGDGHYSAQISTATFSSGKHSIRVREVVGGKTSPFSINRDFSVSTVFFPVTDLNNDGKINISDWSIFLSLWTSKNEEARKRIDFNGDGKVDLADFSIFMQSLRQQ